MTHETIQEVTETVEALARKVRAEIMNGNGTAAREFAEALRDACAGLASLVEAVEVEEEDDDD